MTVQEQAEQHRANYRARCTHRRVGKSLTELSSGETENFPSINKAKAAVRSRKLTVHH